MKIYRLLVCGCLLLIFCSCSKQKKQTFNAGTVIADERIIYKVPASPENIFVYSPSLIELPNGRLLAGFDLGGSGVSKLPEPQTTGWRQWNIQNQAKIYCSDDKGKSWKHICDLPMFHARFFRDGNNVYFIGHDKAITICSSSDNGETWGPVKKLDDNALWHQAPCAVHYEKDYIYLTMEKSVGSYWPDVAPVVMRGKRGTDLTDKKNWTFSNVLLYPSNAPTTSGIPFYTTGFQTPDKADKKYCGAPCFLESHVVKIYDKQHNLYDKNTLYLFMRQHSGLTNIAALAKCVINENKLTLDFVRTPAGAMLFHIPFPGGHMKFDVLYDHVSQLYWLVSSQATDSMTRPDMLPADRYNLPDNERNRLVLYFSKNMFDWNFAGTVAIGKTTKESRHYASMIISGNDLLILSRSGTENAKTAHNGDIITLHKVNDFRALRY